MKFFNENHPTFIMFVLCCLFFGCTKKEKLIRSVYHWETMFDLQKQEINFLNRQGIEKVYTKFFDLTTDSEGTAMPVAKVQFIETAGVEIVPVVYITTAVFVGMELIAVEKLAKQTYELIVSLHPEGEFSEIQMDCDWMDSIQENYFHFLQKLKTLMGKRKLSCTIRLYQYKYPDLAGVPPVDNGVLMYYNMGSISDYNETNSILNNEIGTQYMGYGEYPLPLDFALPSFSWSLLYRYGKFKGILRDVDFQELSDSALFKNSENDYYVALRDTLYKGVYLRKGDEIRYEFCSDSSLFKAIDYLKLEKNQKETTLLFYDLKPNLIYESDQISSMFNAFE